MYLRTVVVLFSLLAFALSGNAQEIKDNKLTVYGKVRVFAKADRASINFAIKGVGSSLNAAFDNARTKIDSIATKLFALGLTKDNLSTSFFRNEENFGDKAFLSSKKDYRAIMTATITTDKLDLLEQIAVILSNSSIERISGVSFDLVNYSQLRLDAFQKAVSAAMEKAKIISAQLGVQCGDVLECEEGISEGSSSNFLNANNGPYNRYITAFRAGIDNGTRSVMLSPEEVQFDSEVKVVLAIKGN